MPAQVTIDNVDKSILLALSEIGRPARPREIAERAGIDARRVAAKMRKLRRLGLVNRVGEGVYVVTEEGKRLIAMH